MENKKDIESLLSALKGARLLSPLELNEIRFSGRRTVITPSRLRNKSKKNG